MMVTLSPIIDPRGWLWLPRSRKLLQSVEGREHCCLHSKWMQAYWERQELLHYPTLRQCLSWLAGLPHFLGRTIGRFGRFSKPDEGCRIGPSMNQLCLSLFLLSINSKPTKVEGNILWWLGNEIWFREVVEGKSMWRECFTLMSLHVLSDSEMHCHCRNQCSSCHWLFPVTWHRSWKHRIWSSIILALRILETCNHYTKLNNINISAHQFVSLPLLIALVDLVGQYRITYYRTTYYVPTTLLVFAWIWSSPNILAIPKSEIFGFIAESRRTLLALRSRCMILSLESWWRYKTPRAIPRIILKRWFQSRVVLFASSVVQSREERIHWPLCHEIDANGEAFQQLD